MKESTVYQQIKEILWLEKDEHVQNVFLNGYVYENSSAVGSYENSKNGELIVLSSEDFIKIESLMTELQQYHNSLNKHWTHFELFIADEGTFEAEFLYIPEEDHWHGLVMQGISDLTEEEWKNTGIPRELWEERVRHKGTGTLGQPKSDFYK